MGLGKYVFFFLPFDVCVFVRDGDELVWIFKRCVMTQSIAAIIYEVNLLWRSTLTC